MPKKRETKSFSFQGFDNAHYKATEAYTRAIGALYSKATADIAHIAVGIELDPHKQFAFVDHPKMNAAIKVTMNGLAKKAETIIKQGARRQWLFASKKSDDFVASVFDTTKIAKEQLNKMQNRNLDALKSFQQRKVDGLNLSSRVWKYTAQYKDQIELAIDVGLEQGRPAVQLAQDLQQNLQDPDRLFRRVRDKRGNLVLSKAAKAFHPGTGVYRSSYKNAMRLARTEINMAYREADWLRWQQLDFVVGFEVHRSNNEPKCNCKLCEKLVGRYPKHFKFTGWHPQCMCYATAVLMDKDDFEGQELSNLKSALTGGEYKKLSAKNGVTDFPSGFKDWVAENTAKQGNWRSTPYFIRDNFKGGLLSNGLRTQTTKTVETPKIDPIQQQLNELQPSISRIKQLASEWGLNTYIVDEALAKRDLQGVIKAISEVRNRINAAMNELKLFVADAAETIKQAKQANIHAMDLVNALSKINADKRNWITSKDAFKQVLADLKAKILGAIGDIHPAILKKYDTNAEVDETFKKINAEMEPGERWFENGDLKLGIEMRAGNNGSTWMDGRLYLKANRLERVKVALGKIGMGKADTITFAEADAMATYWHEVTHNRNVFGNMRITNTQRDVMEMMNEFVARKTLPDFYKKLGCKETPHLELINNRDSTGYNRRVVGYDFVISKLGLDASKVLTSAKKNLFTLKYSEQETTAIQALLEGGLDKFKRVDGKAIGKAQIKKIVSYCRIGSSISTIETYMKESGIIPK